MSQLRKELGRDAIVTREPGYLVSADRDSIDLHRFERLASDAASALSAGEPGRASELLRDALRLWRGPALADVAEEGIARSAAARLDELRLLALERRIEADLERGLHADVVGEVEALIDAYPLRERPRALHMLALYRCGRQADALAAYRAARETLVTEIGIDPGAPLQELERAILRQDPELALDGPSPARPTTASAHAILVAALSLEAADGLLALAAPLAQVSHTRAGHRGPGRRTRASSVRRRRPCGRTGNSSWSAASRLARPHSRPSYREPTWPVSQPSRRRTSCSSTRPTVCSRTPACCRCSTRPPATSGSSWEPLGRSALCSSPSRARSTTGPPSNSAPGWLGQRALRSRLAGAATGTAGRDSSRLLASVSLAIQRVLGVDAEPLLVDPTPDALVGAAADAGVVVVGLTDRWRREGLGRARAALATAGGRPAVLVRRGLRPGGLAPRDSDTRFTWTVGPIG